MAFRATNVIPQNAYETVRVAATNLKYACQGFNSFMASNNTDYDYLRDIYVTLSNANTQFETLKTTPGLAAHAKIQENDDLYAVGAEFNAMQSAISGAMTWMVNNVPTSVTAKSADQWDNSTLISTTFTPAQTSGLRTELDAINSAIS